jgi:hypothetical protein
LSFQQTKLELKDGHAYMASSGKTKTTMAKRSREAKLRERRIEKAAKKEARKLAAADEADRGSAVLTEEEEEDTETTEPQSL